MEKIKRPRILLSGCDEPRPDYEEALERSGCIVISRYMPGTDISFDGLVLGGGNDVSPSHYGQKNVSCQEPDEKRDLAELALVSRCIREGKPILGICRGMQLINVALGGSLYQDIGDRLRLFHSDWEGPDYRVHSICTGENTVLRSLYGETLMVNSVHHQSVDRLGEGLYPAAWSESGLVEAVQHERFPVLGVQFHPEKMCWSRARSDTVDGAAIFNWFAELVRRKFSG